MVVVLTGLLAALARPLALQYDHELLRGPSVREDACRYNAGLGALGVRPGWPAGPGRLRLLRLVEELSEEVQRRAPEIGAGWFCNGDRDVLHIDADVERGAGGWLVRGAKCRRSRMTAGDEAQASSSHGMFQRRL